MTSLKEFLISTFKKIWKLLIDFLNDLVFEYVPLILSTQSKFYTETLPTFLYETKYVVRIFIIFFWVDQPFGQEILYHAFGEFYASTVDLLMLFLFGHFYYSSKYYPKVEATQVSAYTLTTWLDFVCFLSTLYDFMCYYFLTGLHYIYDVYLIYFFCYFKYIILPRLFLTWKPIFKKLGQLYRFFKKNGRF
jgi:hypothetical protein